MNDILKNIDEIRRKKGFSQEYIAQKIGMKQSGLSLIMSGGRELKYSTLVQIAKALEENVIDVITYPEVYLAEKETFREIEATLEIKLDARQRDKVLQIVLGDKGMEILQK